MTDMQLQPGDDPSPPGPSKVELVRTRSALNRARRLLDDQRGRTGAGPAFNDYLPFVLDGLAHVARVLDAESKGRRTPQFGMWWKAAKVTVQDPISDLRNDELKEGKRRTSEALTLPLPDGRPASRIYGVSLNGPDGYSLGVDHVMQVPKGASIEWVITGEHSWTGKSVLDALEDHWTRLRDEIIPEAERLLSLTSAGKKPQT